MLAVGNDTVIEKVTEERDDNGEVNAILARVDESADAAVASLTDAESLVDALAGWLRHGFADGYARLADSPHGAELLEAHHAFSADVAEQASTRMRSALERHLRQRPDLDPARVDGALELLPLSPTGLKADQPTPAAYMRRLDRLADAVAALLLHP